MRLNAYSIYDKAVQAYAKIFFLRTDAEAKRGFTAICMDAEGDIYRAPQDYTLFRVGEFDDGTGELSGCDPMPVARAHEVIAAQQGKEQRQLDVVEGGKANA